MGVVVYLGWQYRDRTGVLEGGPEQRSQVAFEESGNEMGEVARW